LQGTGGRGARANGHEGYYHDGLRSLYDFRTLFHGTSTHPKEAEREVAGLKALLENQDVPFRRNRLRQASVLSFSSFSPLSHFLLPRHPSLRTARVAAK
jgi:hypothetical protein